jgi:glycosyltransferase involved in cell wall biosynthesis
MSLPFVSVVIPTYNYGRYVTEAVDSVLAQTRPAGEVIVVDDGSTDDTRERLRPYLNRIRYVYQENRGLPVARNTGIRAARGDLIALLDSDDLWHPRKLELQVPFLIRSPEVGLVAVEAARDLTAGWPEVAGPFPPPARRVTLRDLLIRSRFGPSSVLVRKSCFDAVGLFDPDLRSAEDRDMWVRIAARFAIERVAAPLWWYRLHGGNMSAAAVRMEENEMKVLTRALATLHPEQHGWLLRRKVVGYTVKSAAYRYDMAGQHLPALARVLRSLALWPVPFRADEALTRWERPKMLVLFALRLLRDLAADGVMRPRGFGRAEALARSG